MNNFSEIPTTCISDVMDGLSNMHTDITPLSEHYKLVGRAFTVKIPVGDNLLFLKAILEAKPGDVLVVDIQDDTYRAIAGDFMLGMAKTLGINGVVTNGSIRDIQGIKDLDFPVFCKGTTVASSKKYGLGEINIPISCGGTTINPGDIIVGDADGVTVVPEHQEESVYKKALQKLKADDKRDNEISGNPELIKDYIMKQLEKNK